MVEAIRNLGKRLNIILDGISFGKLAKTRKRHNDSSYTASLKRAIVTTSFIEDELAKDENQSIFVRNRKTGEVREVIVVR